MIKKTTLYFNFPGLIYQKVSLDFDLKIQMKLYIVYNKAQRG